MRSWIYLVLLFAGFAACVLALIWNGGSRSPPGSRAEMITLLAKQRNAFLIDAAFWSYLFVLFSSYEFMNLRAWSAAHPLAPRPTTALLIAAGTILPLLILVGVTLTAALDRQRQLTAARRKTRTKDDDQTGHQK